MIESSGLTASAGPSLFIIETGASLIAFAAALFWPRAGSRWFSKAEVFLGRLARRRGLSVAVVALAAVSIRLAILPLSPIPQPFIHDEFANQLASNTFATGRLTNPTHPMWVHLESFHITQKPTYMSMYFAAQGLVLAAGEALTGMPWFGVVLSTGIMCSAICWMAQGWVPPGWALFGGMLAVGRLALFSYWVDGYYGGSVAAVGGALVLGALPRIRRTAQIRHGLLMVLGVAILANSRPYEGLLVCIPVAWALARWLLKDAHPPPAVLLRRALAPATLALVAAAMTGYYNYRVFGNALTLPYQVNRATYASAPVFLWQSPRPQPEYRHELMREFYVKWEMGDFREARSLAGFGRRTAQKAGVAVLFLCGVVLLAPLAMFPRVLRDRRVRFLVIAGAVYAAGLTVNAWLFAHYLAPLTAAAYVLLLQAMRHLRVWGSDAQPWGRALMRAIPVVCLILIGVRLFAAPLGIAIPRWPTMWYGTERLGLPRAGVLDDLKSRPGKQLAVVRYAPGHPPFDDWVYNAADIDKAQVVWAREMDAQHNRQLLRYFDDRQVWLVEPDQTPPRISPYRLAAQ